MKTIAAIGLLMCVMATASYGDDTHGSVFGTLETATVVGQARGDFGFGIGLADNATSFTGSFTYGLSRFMDGRIKLGLVDPDYGGDTEVGFGGDIKWQYWDYGPGTTYPFDMAFGGFFEFVDYGSRSVLQIGGFVLGSYPLNLRQGGTISPYGRFNARIEALSSDSPVNEYSGDHSDTNLRIGLNMGVKWQMTPTWAFMGELQIDGNDGLFIGADWGVM